jgi:colicin import membrane protein
MKTKDIKSTEKKISSLDKVKALKEKIIANANALADRILSKAIAKEEQEKAWETRKKELKAEAAKKRKEAALKKREEKAKKLSQIHSSIPTKDTSKKQKAIDKAIEEKHDEKMIAKETKFEDFNPKRQKLTKEERIERNKKRAIKLIHHKEIKDKIKHITKEEKEKIAAEARKAGYLAYKAEMQKQASEIAADPKAYQIRQEKRKKSEQERLNMLAEKRKARMDKLQRVELTQKQKTLKDLEHFKLAQERRNEKKLQRRQMYLSKGSIQLPKVKNKVEIRPIVEQPKKQDSSKHRYIVRTQYIDQPSLTGDRVGAIVCLPDKLKDIVKYSFNKMMEKESDKVVGYFIYDSDNPEVCIMEMVNSKYREIDGVTITRLQKQDKTAA